MPQGKNIHRFAYESFRLFLVAVLIKELTCVNFAADAV